MDSSGTNFCVLETLWQESHQFGYSFSKHILPVLLKDYFGHLDHLDKSIRYCIIQRFTLQMYFTSIYLWETE